MKKKLNAKGKEKRKAGRRPLPPELRKGANRFGFGAKPEDAEQIRRAAESAHMNPNAFVEKTVLDKAYGK